MHMSSVKILKISLLMLVVRKNCGNKFLLMEVSIIATIVMY